MNLHLRRAIWCVLLGLDANTLVIGAEVGASDTPSTENVIDGTSQAVGWFSSELEILIGIVVLALVVIARIRKAP